MNDKSRDSTNKSRFRRLVELNDLQIKKAFQDDFQHTFFVSESRMDNLMWCLEDGAMRITAMSTRIKKLEAENKRLKNDLLDALDIKNGSGPTALSKEVSDE